MSSGTSGVEIRDGVCVVRVGAIGEALARAPFDVRRDAARALVMAAGWHEDEAVRAAFDGGKRARVAWVQLGQRDPTLADAAALWNARDTLVDPVGVARAAAPYLARWWDRCTSPVPLGDWLWHVDRRACAWALAGCARLVLATVDGAGDAAHEAIERVEAWATGQITAEELEAARKRLVANPAAGGAWYAVQYAVLPLMRTLAWQPHVRASLAGAAASLASEAGRIARERAEGTTQAARRSARRRQPAAGQSVPVVIDYAALRAAEEARLGGVIRARVRPELSA